MKELANTSSSYDIFVVTAPADRDEAQNIADAMRDKDLRVFVDDGTVDNANEALLRSHLMAPYYSTHFPNQPHCQHALLGAFLAGHGEGDPLKYVATINPDDPVTAHITPVEISDAKYVVPAIIGLPKLIGVMAAKAAKNLRPIGKAQAPPDPQWFGQSLDTLQVEPAARISDLWALHNELIVGDFPLTQGETCGTRAVISGPAKVGKTALALCYAQLFGAQYQGGVYYMSLRGCVAEKDALCNRYAQELDQIRQLLGLSSPAEGDDTLLDQMTDHLEQRTKPSLWIVDDIPNLQDDRLADELIPLEGRVHTILISRQRIFRFILPQVSLGNNIR